ncbi:precorrin-3B synthase [Terrabacter aeriphilus]|uniref:Precorrin-3B synthase n=1 Tax=Terrabacter aeriphilus TaxID=515662 RepID=A0ABP9JM00_9MICO
MRVQALVALLDVVAAQADPSLQLTSRAALQLRGLADPLPASVVDGIRSSGLVPSATHELVRNVVVSPLSGLDSRGVADLRPLTRSLDVAVRADAELAALGGRFLFVLDDGRGDVINTAADLSFVATGPGRGIVRAGRADHGWDVSIDSAVPTIVGLAREFVGRAAGDESIWHVDDLDDPLGGSATARLPALPAPSQPLGAVGDHAVVAVPLGLLRPDHVAALGRHAESVRVTPWRSLVVEGAASALPHLEAAGLVTHAHSPWARMHACTGLPGCARSALDTRALARELAPVLPDGRLPVHVSGCERRCGTPETAYVDVLEPTSLDDALHQIAAQPAEDGSRRVDG